MLNIFKPLKYREVFTISCMVGLWAMVVDLLAFRFSYSFFLKKINGYVKVKEDNSNFSYYNIIMRNEHLE